MKKFLAFFAAFMISAATLLPAATPSLAQAAPKAIPVLVDTLPVVFDVQPTIKSGRTLVPFRAIAEALNVNVTWDAKTRTVSATDGKASIRLQIDNKTAYRNEQPITLDVAPVIIGGRTLIPIRFFSEGFGCSVAWDAKANTVSITSPPRAMEVLGYYALGGAATSSWTDLFGTAYPEASPGNTDLVSDLAFGWYSLNDQGELLLKSRTGWQRPDGWEKVLETAGQYHLNTEMVVHLTDGDGTISSLLANEAAIKDAAAAIAQEAKLYNGVNLDFEGLGLKDSGDRLVTVQQSFTHFVQVLSDQLKPEGTRLTLSLHAPNSAYKGYDYKSLGQIADRIVIMAYDYGSKPEPVSLVVQAVEKASAVVPQEKLLLGISVPAETPESVLVKVGIAKRYKLAGIALWRLGLVPDDMWSSLKSTIQTQNN